MSSKRIKEIIKNAEPAKGTNADPGQLGQYSATNQVSEGGLQQYLSSRGINPKFASKEVKISHAKSGTFKKWKTNHKVEEVETEEPLIEDAMLDKYLSSRGINPKYATRNMKVAHSKSGQFIKWKHDHQFESVVTEETDKKDMICMDIPLLIRVLEFTREDMSSDIELHNMVERLINMRHDVPLDMTHYDDITKNLVKEAYEQGIQGHLSQGTLDSIKNKRHVQVNLGEPSNKPKPKTLVKKPEKKKSFLSKIFSSEETELDESPKEGGKRKFSGMYNPAPKGTFAYDQAMRKKKHDEIEKNQSKDGSGMTSAIDRLQAHLNKEEVVNEMDKTQDAPGRDNDGPFNGPDKTAKPVKADKAKKDILKLLKKKMNNEEVELDESSKDNPRHPMHQSDPSLYKKTAKSITKQYATHAGKFFSNKDTVDYTLDYKKTDKEAPRYRNEDTLDPLAATQSPNDCGTSPNDVSPKKQAMSKSARMIKSLYKKHNMKEDTYDWEKDDKNQTSPGKKTKEPKEEPDARAILTGGKTLTGDKRDTLEIDPMMKNRPDLNGTVKDDENTKKNNKINN